MLDNFFLILLYLLIGEGIMLFLLIFIIVIHRFHSTRKEKNEKKRQEVLTDYFLAILERKLPFDREVYPGKESWYRSVLIVLEGYNRRLIGDDFFKMKKDVVDALLLKRARKWAHSRLWMKRNFASRTLGLYAEPADEAILIKLIEDKKYLVRNPASFALVNLESELGVQKILEAIKKEPGYPQFLYRDALLTGSPKVLEILGKFGHDPNFHYQVLDVLSAKSWGGAIPFLEESLKSQDTNTYLLALKVLLRNPLPNSSEYFQGAATHPDPAIRKVAMQGVKLFPTDQLYPLLEKGINDDDWHVRVEAGKSLKSLGEEGVNVLNRQQGKGLEAASFVLNFE